MNNLPKSAISPLVIASKLAAADNLTEPIFAEKLLREPRYAELLSFLQWITSQPGGLGKFAGEVLAEFAPQFGPDILHDENGILALEQRIALWKALPDERCEATIPFLSWADRASQERLDERKFPWGETCYPSRISDSEKARFSAALMKIPRDKFRQLFLDAAREHLPSHLRSICEGPARWIDAAPWYCERITQVLLEAMDAHAARIKETLAQTEVVRLTFDRLDYAWHSKALVKIEGDARTGKSESIKAWCAMYPGRGRLVSTPSSTSLRDLIMAVAEALGLPFTPNVDTADLKDRVRFIIQHSRLFLIFDEAHFLLPANYGRNTSPARLDWVRTEIVDKGLPVALVCTPQAFRHSVERFQKWTGYNFAQFLGRIMLNVTLPNELSKTDLLAVAAIQGSDIPQKYHSFIVALSMQSEGYLKTIEAICKRTRYIAQRDGHPIATQADVELAAFEVVPFSPASAAATPAAPARQNQPVAVKRGRTSTAPPVALRQSSPVSALEMPTRATTPDLETV